MKKEVLMTFGVIFGLGVLTTVVFLFFLIAFPFKYKENILFNCEVNQIDKSLVASVIYVESRYRSDVVSKKGAVGLMQVMPATAKSFYYGKEFTENILLNPNENIKIGVAFLKYLFDKYNDETTVLACYNAGEGVVREWMKGAQKLEKTQIRYKETLNYVKKVQMFKKLYKLYLNF